MKPIVIISTKRSGHHAFIEWITENLNGSWHYENNINTQIEHKLHGRVTVHADTMIEPVRGIYSYENTPLNIVQKHRPFKQLIDPIQIIFLRDPLNTFASMIQYLQNNPDADYNAHMSDTVDCWSSLANYVLTKHNTTIQIISMNYWIRTRHVNDPLNLELKLVKSTPNTTLSKFARGGNTWFDKSDYNPDTHTLESRYLIKTIQPKLMQLYRLNSTLAELSIEWYQYMNSNPQFESWIKNAME